MSNFYSYKFKKESETFGSVEAYWYWLGINCERDKKQILCLRSGFEAKNMGRQLEEKYGKFFDPEFEHKILSAIWIKIKNNKSILVNIPNLPLEHYYVFGNKIYDVKKNYPWMMDGIEKMLNYIKTTP